MASVALNVKSKEKQGRRRWLELICVALFVWSIVDLVLITFLAEDSWLSMFATYLPHGPHLLLAAVLLAVTVVKRRWRTAVLSAAAGAVFLVIESPELNSAGESKSGGRRSVRVLTYNLREGLDDPNAIAALIRGVNPDIVLLQEARFLASESPRSAPLLRLIRTKSWSIRREGRLAILSKHPVLRTWTPELQVPTHAWALFAEIQVGSETIVAASIHMNPVHWDRFLSAEFAGLSEHLRTTGRIRQQQAKSLLDELSALRARQDFIVAGDFNGPPRGRVYERLSERMQDAFGSSGFGFGWTIPSRLPLSRLDYVFAAKSTRVQSVHVLDGTGSDHRALSARMTLK